MHFVHSYIKNVSVWDPTAHFKHCWVRICILEGPEDDSIRIETCCPNTIMKHNKVLLCLTDTSLHFRLVWPCVMNVGWRERNQQDETNLMFIIKIYLNMFRASLCSSSGEQECALPYMVFCTVCDGCGCVELGRELCALWKSNSNFHSAHKSRPSSTQPQPSQTMQNTICGSAHSCSPDDGHNDDRNMLR